MQLNVKDVDDKMVAKARKKAKARGWSLSELVRRLLAEFVKGKK